MSTAQMFDADGKPLNGIKILPDRASIKVRMTMMDSAHEDIAAITRKALADAGSANVMHRPGFVTISDADRDAREKAIDARDRRVQDAWRNPPPEAAKMIAPLVADVDAAAARRDARVRDAWRGVA